MIDVFLSFDTEDPIHPEADGALLRICRTLADAGVPGNFFMVGEKARLLRERGRRDVLEALAVHELEYHGNWWFEFPECALQYGEQRPWDEAVAYGCEIELPGLHDVAEICGQWPVAWCQHQNNCCAPMPHIMRRLGVQLWNGGFGSGPLRGWLMDQMVLTRSAHVMSLQGSWGGWHHDPLNPQPPDRVMDPEAEFRAFQERFDQIASQHGAVVPLGHPTCWAMAEWWGWYEWAELCHYRAPEPYLRHAARRRVERRSSQDIEAHFEWFKRVCDWLAARSDCHVTTFGEFAERHREPGLLWLDLEAVDAIAEASLAGPRAVAVAGTTLSAADVLGVFAHLFATITREHRIPAQVAVQRLLGPVEAPHPAAKLELAGDTPFKMAGVLYDYLVTHRRLPAVLRTVKDFGPATATMVFATAWLQHRRAETWPDKYVIEPPGELPVAAAMDFFQQPQASSSHATPGYQTSRMRDQVRWQSWSYRPFAADVAG